MSTPDDDLAPEGTVWVCQACGKRARDKVDGGIAQGWDSSCYLWSVLCTEDSIKLDDSGRVIAAAAVKP